MERNLKLSIQLLTSHPEYCRNHLIAKIKRRKRINEIILASLSVSDCLFSLSNAIIFSIFLAELPKSEEDLLEATYIAVVFFVLASVFHLTFIAVESSNDSFNTLSI